MTVKRKRNKRSMSKYPALVPYLNSKIKQEFINEDYVSKLSTEEKEWLNSFNEEWVNARMNHPGKKLHKTTVDKRKCYNMNNERNRDIYGQARAYGGLVDLDAVEKTITQDAYYNREMEFETMMIELLDHSMNGDLLDELEERKWQFDYAIENHVKSRSLLKKLKNPKN